MTLTDRVIRIIIPSLVAALVIGVVLAEPQPAAIEVKIYAPEEVLPGSDFGVRVSGLTGVMADEYDGDIVVTFADETTTHSMRGVWLSHLRAPASPGRYTLRVTTDEPESVVTRDVHVVANAKRATARGHLQTELQRFALRPATGEVPSPFELRFLHGSCAPELPCKALVWVGEPFAHLGARELRGVTMLRFPADEPAAYAELEMVVAGSEAALTLAVLREPNGEDAIGQREIIVPVEMAVPSLAVDEPVSRAFPRIAVQHLRDEATVAYAIFYDERWVRSFQRPLRDGFQWPADLPARPGIYRVQARVGLFGAEPATVVFYLAAPNEEAARTRQRIAEFTRERGYGSGAIADAAVGDRFANRYLLADAELSLLALPNASSSRAQLPATGSFSNWRLFVAALILLLGIVTSVILTRHGLRANRDARALLTEAGMDDVAGGSRTLKMTLSVVASALFVTCVFAAVASIVMARSCMAS